MNFTHSRLAFWTIVCYNDYTMERFVILLAGFLAAIVVISFHEFAHAYVAYKCGDPTAKFSGRMTLNPIKHFDPLGAVLFALAGFGWAKPVPINPNNFRNYRKGCFLTSAAGVAMNYVTAFLFYPIFLLVQIWLLPRVAGTYAQIFFFQLFFALFAYSLNFCAFNLLPVYPLDGFRMVDALDKKRSKVYWFLRQYGYYVLLGLVLLNIAADYIPVLEYINVLQYVMGFITDILGLPIMKFWNWIFGLIF